MRERVEALFIGADWYFDSRRVQLLTLATRLGIATSYSNRIFPEAGGLMSYGTDLAEMYRRVGAYTGHILKGAKPADLPVVQSTRLEFVINMQTARALDIEVPPIMLARADHLINIGSVHLTDSATSHSPLALPCWVQTPPLGL
jgi:putative ABC transport system substrate-binding protein